MRLLDAQDQELILGYYRGGQHAKIESRPALVATFGITADALSIRVCRIRDGLETGAHKWIRKG